jgi:hypothetical protein
MIDEYLLLVINNPSIRMRAGSSVLVKNILFFRKVSNCLAWLWNLRMLTN